MFMQRAGLPCHAWMILKWTRISIKPFPPLVKLRRSSVSLPPPATFKINVTHGKATYFSSLFPLIFNRIKFRSVFPFLKALLPYSLRYSSRARLCFQGLTSMSLFSYELCLTEMPSLIWGKVNCGDIDVEAAKAQSDRHLPIAATTTPTRAPSSTRSASISDSSHFLLASNISSFAASRCTTWTLWLPIRT